MAKSGTASIVQSMVSRNNASVSGGGINSQGITTLKNSIVDGNSPNVPGADVKETFSTDSGHNVIGIIDDSSGLVSPTTVSGTVPAPVDAKLGVLSDNGGPEQDSCVAEW